jgi:hypothetical protein
MADEETYSTRRRGKIAQCPRRVREEICRRLDNGAQGDQILPWLNAQPEVKALIAERWNGFEISDNNLSEWFKGGFLDWQKKETEVDNTERLAEFSMRLAKATGGSMSEGAVAVAGGKLLTALESAEGKQLLGLVTGATKLRGVELTKERVDIQRERNRQRDEIIDLDRQKFQRLTAELFLKWFANKQAEEIAAGADRKEVKMDKLIELMFGARPEAETPA